MTSLRVIPVELFTRLTNLLDHDEIAVLLNDPLDLWLHMSWNDDEPVSLREDLLVDGRRQLDLLQAWPVRALAMERHRVGDPMKLGPFLDPTVHVTKNLLVPCSSPCEVHDPDHPRPSGRYTQEDRHEHLEALIATSAGETLTRSA
jgi:hypothetical protein